jgi:hypothetical protein
VKESKIIFSYIGPHRDGVKNAASYYSRKDFYVINLQVVIDFRLLLLAFDAVFMIHSILYIT